MKDRKILALGALASVLVLTTGALWLQRGSAGDFAQCSSTVVSGGMDSFGTSFTLTDETGARVTDAQVFDRPSILYFGYTFCPDVCPLDAARNAEAIDLLKGRGIDAKPVFITVDPARDTPEVLADFTDALHPDMVGLTGTAEEIAAANKGWRNYYKAQDSEDSEYYLVDHMTSSFLVLPDQGTVEVFHRDLPAQDMADKAACFIEAAS